MTVYVHSLFEGVIFNMFTITLDIFVQAFAFLPEAGGGAVDVAYFIAQFVLADDDLVTAYLQCALVDLHIAGEGADLLGLVHHDLIRFDLHGLVAVVLFRPDCGNAQPCGNHQTNFA